MFCVQDKYLKNHKFTMATSAAASSCASPDFIEEASNIEFSTILEVIPQLSPGQLLELIQLAAKELGKSGKSLQKMEKTAGVRPPQLSKSTNWTDYVEAFARENGWEPFTMQEKKKNKLTGEVVTEVVEMTCSEMGPNGVHVFVGMRLKNGDPKTFNKKEAMSLAKKLKEEDAPLYQQYLTESKAEAPAAKAVSKRVTKSAEQIEEERVAKLEAEAEAKAEKKRVADEAKAEKKRLAEEKKAEEKAAKAAAAKPVVPKTLTVMVKRPVTPPPAAAAAAVAAAPAAAVAAAPAPAKKSAKPAAVVVKSAKPAKAAKAAPVWVAPKDDGVCSPWLINGIEYWRDKKNGLFDGEQEWAGLYIEAEDRIDATVAEPEVAAAEEVVAAAEEVAADSESEDEEDDE